MHSQSKNGFSRSIFLAAAIISSNISSALSIRSSLGFSNICFKNLVRKGIFAFTRDFGISEYSIAILYCSLQTSFKVF